MAKEGSIAPKERINITYVPATGDAQEEMELPLKTLVLGDFTGRADDTPIEEREAISIDKDNFNEVIEAQAPKVQLSVANKLSGEEGEEMAVELGFNHIRDFDPENVVRSVPELKKLLELREALVALKGPLGNVPAFRKRIREMLDNEEERNKLIAELGVAEGNDEPAE